MRPPATTPATEDERLVVLVPCFNEATNVAGTVEAIFAEQERLPVALEVLLIDDGSTDGTREVMEEICARRPECRMKVNPRNLGLGRSVLSAYADLDEDAWVTTLPGDNEIFFSSIHRFMEVRDSYDLILGYFGNPVIRTATRRLASFSFTKLVGVLYGFPYRYLNGLKMARVRCFKGIEVVAGGHAFTAEMIAKAVLRTPGMRIAEMPFLARGRATGSSKAFRPGSIARAVGDVIRGYLSVARYRREVIASGND